MRTVTVTRDEHGLVRFTFDAETARVTGMTAFTMDEGAAADLSDEIRDAYYGNADGTSIPFIGIVHDGGEVNIILSASEL